jgi:hypothetical protein
MTTPNALPALLSDPGGGSLNLSLPPGTLVDTTADGAPWPEPLLWFARQPANAAGWLALRAARSVGLLPVLIEAGGSSAPGGPGRWNLLPAMMSSPADHDAGEVLADLWDVDGDIDDDPEEWEEVLAPYRAGYPGLAPRRDPDAEPDDRAADVAATSLAAGELDEPRLALVPAARSADIPAAIGWCGPLNHENDVARLCAVLRSWEDRFGIRVVALTHDLLTVSVAAPPRTQVEAEQVAAEHFAFCPDNITQGYYETLREYAAKAVLGRHVWHFWWD